MKNPPYIPKMLSPITKGVSKRASSIESAPQELALLPPPQNILMLNTISNINGRIHFNGRSKALAIFGMKRLINSPHSAGSITVNKICTKLSENDISTLAPLSVKNVDAKAITVGIVNGLRMLFTIVMEIERAVLPLKICTRMLLVVPTGHSAMSTMPSFAYTDTGAIHANENAKTGSTRSWLPMPVKMFLGYTKTFLKSVNVSDIPMPTIMIMSVMFTKISAIISCIFRRANLRKYLLYCKKFCNIAVRKFVKLKKSNTMEILYGFSQEELDENKEMDSFIRKNVDWDLIPILIKKRIVARRMAYATKTQGKLGIADYFYADSEPVVEPCN